MKTWVVQMFYCKKEKAIVLPFPRQWLTMCLSLSWVILGQVSPGQFRSGDHLTADYLLGGEDSNLDRGIQSPLSYH
jgi:hypothetical protein